MSSFPYKELKKIVLLPTLLVVICWSLFSINYFFNLELFQFGISPRKLDGLVGILVAPMLHVEFNHLLNNTLPLFILSSMLFYFYKPIAWPVFFWIYFISGIWLWVGGRNNDVTPFYHFGASILIYGYSTFLFFSGVFRKHKQLMVVSSIVVFLYGSITWGIFPVDESVSWEGHLFGALSGILVAYFYKQDGPQKVEYHWPDDDETDIDYMQTDEIIIDEDSRIEKEELPSTNPFPVNYVYHFKEKEKE
jgi:membrane associated rhomboid family serine protease